MNGSLFLSSSLLSYKTLWSHSAVGVFSNCAAPHAQPESTAVRCRVRQRHLNELQLSNPSTELQRFCLLRLIVFTAWNEKLCDKPVLANLRRYSLVKTDKNLSLSAILKVLKTKSDEINLYLTKKLFQASTRKLYLNAWTLQSLEKWQKPTKNLLHQQQSQMVLTFQFFQDAENKKSAAKISSQHNSSQMNCSLSLGNSVVKFKTPPD